MKERVVEVRETIPKWACECDMCAYVYAAWRCGLGHFETRSISVMMKERVLEVSKCIWCWHAMSVRMVTCDRASCKYFMCILHVRVMIIVYWWIWYHTLLIWFFPAFPGTLRDLQSKPADGAVSRHVAIERGGCGPLLYPHGTQLLHERHSGMNECVYLCVCVRCVYVCVRGVCARVCMCRLYIPMGRSIYTPVALWHATLTPLAHIITLL